MVTRVLCVTLEKKTELPRIHNGKLKSYISHLQTSTLESGFRTLTSHRNPDPLKTRRHGAVQLCQHYSCEYGRIRLLTKLFLTQTCSLGFFTAVTCYLLFKWALQPILIQRGWIRMNTFQVGDDEASFPVPNESRNDDN